MATVTNITMTADLNCCLNLHFITLRSINCIYYRRPFDQLIIRLRDPYVTILVYSSGKLVLTGAKSEDSGRRGLRIIARKIQKIGYNVKLTNLTTANMAATYDCQTSIPLHSFAKFLGKNASYETELYPNLIYKSNKKSIIVSSRGRLILTGCKNINEINNLNDFIIEKLFLFML